MYPSVDGIVKLISDEHPLKQYDPKLTNPSGRSASFNEMHCSNAALPIVLSFSPLKLMSDNEVQL